MNDESVHVLPIVVMFAGMLAVAAGVLAEFDGGGPQRGRASLILVAFGVALIVGGALLPRT